MSIPHATKTPDSSVIKRDALAPPTAPSNSLDASADSLAQRRGKSPTPLNRGGLQSSSTSSASKSANVQRPGLKRNAGSAPLVPRGQRNSTPWNVSTSMDGPPTRPAKTGARDSLLHDEFFRAYRSPQTEQLTHDLQLIWVEDRKGVRGVSRKRTGDSRAYTGDAREEALHRLLNAPSHDGDHLGPQGWRRRARTTNSQASSHRSSPRHERATSEASVTQRAKSRSRSRNKGDTRIPGASQLGSARRSSSVPRSVLSSQSQTQEQQPVLPHLDFAPSPDIQTLVGSMKSPTSFYFADSQPSSREGDGSKDSQGPGSFLDIDPLEYIQPQGGRTLVELVTRLLTPRSGKGDFDFVTDFLTFYRFFMAPSELLEAVIYHAETIPTPSERLMRREGTLLCDLRIINEWISSFPGDFAHTRTQNMLSDFLDRLGESGVHHELAELLKIHIGGVTHDDDTRWIHSDKEMANRLESMVEDALQRPSTAKTIRSASSMDSLTLSSPTSPNSSFGTASTCPTDLDTRLIFRADTTRTMSAIGSLKYASGSTDYSTYSAIIAAGSAQAQARRLVPKPNYSLSKVQWRALMGHSDDAIARELTHIEWIMFSAVRPRDFIRHVTVSRSDRTRYSSLESVTRMVNHFNHIACWATNMILLRDKPKHRAQMLEKLMRVARKLRELNNYSSLGALVTGVSATSVHRLNATRELIDPMLEKDFLKLEILMSTQKSHAPYRLAWENTNSARIPYLPVLMRDLTIAQGSNKTFLERQTEDGTVVEDYDEDGPLINWKKFEILGDVLRGVQRAQATPYTELAAAASKDVRKLVLETAITTDDNALHDRSKALEGPDGPVFGVGTLEAGVRRKLTVLAERYGLGERY